MISSIAKFIFGSLVIVWAIGFVMGMVVAVVVVKEHPEDYDMKNIPRVEQPIRNHQ